MTIRLGPAGDGISRTGHGLMLLLLKIPPDLFHTIVKRARA
jgi:hypothetical protein